MASEAEYRAALSGSVPEAMDDARFGAAMAAACLVFAIIRVHRFPKLDARGAGVPGRLQVVSTLEAAARAAAAHRSLPHLRGWVLEAATALRRAPGRTLTGSRHLRPPHAALAGPAHAASGNPHLRQRVTAP